MAIAPTSLRSVLLGAAGQQVALRSDTTSPAAGAGVADPVGSWWQRAGSFPATPAEIYLKLASPDTGWAKQNLVNLNVFNIKTFGAKGDGVTDDTLSIQAAINACQAAGGGIVYAPPSSVYYRLTKQAGNFSLIFSNAQGVVLLGDGYASKFSMSGSAGGGDWYAIYIVNGSAGVKVTNIYLDGANITNPDPSDQNHGIQLGLVGSFSAIGGVLDIEITDNYFGRFVGDAVRTLGQEAFGGNPENDITDLRVLDNFFDLNNGIIGSRSAIEAQRFTKNVTVAYNWMTGSHDQELDFEPTGGDGSGLSGPTGWNVFANMISHSGGTDAVTQSGISSNEPTLNCSFSRNVLQGGPVAGLNMQNCKYVGNVITCDNAMADSPFAFVRFQVNILIDGNVCVVENGVVPRRAISMDQGNSILPQQIVISNNIAINELTPVGPPIYCDANQSCVIGNICQGINTAAAGNGVFVDIQRAVVGPVQQLACIGNMGSVLPGSAVFLAGCDFHGNGQNVGDTLAAYNIWDGAQASVTWSRAGAETFPNYHGAFGNNLGNTGGGATLNIGPPPTNVGAQIEGQAGPGSQIDLINAAAGPLGNVPAPPGCITMNLTGGQENTFFYKESGTGNVGWLRVGDTELTFGTQALTTATAARFLVPGGQGLATEITTEVSIVVPRAGVARQLRGRFTAGTGVSNITYRVRKNGVDTSLTFNAVATATSGSDTSTQVNFAQSDRASFRTSKDVPPGTPPTNVQICFGFA